MLLEDKIRTRLANKDILLMTHLVMGYPSYDVNREVIRQMVAGGVDLIELQIPFSEPVADGPVILRANQEALTRGVRVRDCINLAAEMAATYPQVSFLFMTYYNIILQYQEEEFFKKARQIGIEGCIVPDVPPEEGKTFLGLAQQYGIAPILIFAPTSSPERMRELGTLGQGFIYCVARRGVTGKKTDFDSEVQSYLGRCREATTLPIAVGFGLQAREDIAFLIGKADIAVVGSATITLVEIQGPAAVGPFITNLLTNPQ